MPRIDPQSHAPWHILGAGSIGCLFAAHLRLAGTATRVVLRDAHSLAQWHAVGGIELRDERGSRLVPMPALAGAAAPAGSIDKLLVCTKAHQTRAALEALRDAIAAPALIVLLQNGMGVREQVATLLPDAIVLNALSTEGAYQVERFRVVHAGRGETLVGAGVANLCDVAQRTAAALHCDLPVRAVDDIDRRLWRKLAVNSVINPLTALHDCRNGAVLDLPDIDTLLPALCAEVCAVANAEGLALDCAQSIDDVRHVCRATAQNRSSMLQDIAARRLTEIDFINGYIVQRAAQHGLACPRQQTLYRRIKELEHRLACR